MQGIHSALSRASVFLSFSPFVSSSSGPNRSVAGRTSCKPHRGHTPFAPLLATLLLTLGAGSSWMSAPAHGFDTGPLQPVPAAVADVAPAHDATVGTAAGEGDTVGGAAVYRMPITVPPGRAGMQPELSLTYSSRGGNGIAGMGWSLGGSSSIHRCPQTIEQDGRTRGVFFDTQDRLCLDGQRLVATSGMYGSPGTVYRTEIDTYTRVTQVGPLTGTGSCFKAEQKSGRVLHYGAPVTGTTCAASARNARVNPNRSPAATLSWLVEREEDRVGNSQFYTYMDVKVGAASYGEVLLERVDYTGFGATPPVAGEARSVQLTYENRPSSTTTDDNDISASYLGGGLSMQTRRLKTIATYVGTERIRIWKLNYLNPLNGRSVSRYSGRSVLQAVEACAGTPTNEVCHPATVFTSHDGAPSHPFRALTIAALPSPAPAYRGEEGRLVNHVEGVPTGTHTFRTIGDLDGDGARETIVLSPIPGGIRTHLVRARPDRTFSAAVDVTSLHLPSRPDEYVDFDGDGRAEAVMASSSPDGWTHLKVWKLGRGQWSTDPNALFHDVATNVPATLTTGIPVTYADFDGDGRTDILVTKPDLATCGGTAQDPKQRLLIYLNRIAGPLWNGAGGGHPAHFVLANHTLVCLNRVEPATLGAPREQFGHVRDFNGDGAADVFLTYAGRPQDQRALFVHPLTPSGGGEVTDLQIDAVLMTTLGLTEAEIRLPDPRNANESDKIAHWVDVNGDGLDDYVFAQATASSGLPARRWIVRLNTGGRFSAPIDTASAAGLGVWGPAGRYFRYSSRIRPFDSNSDGRMELLVPIRIAAMICSWGMRPNPPPQCPRPDSGESVEGCEETMYCPRDPQSGLVPAGTRNLYDDNFGLGPQWDQAAYVVRPQSFVVGAVNGATGLPSITVRELPEDLVDGHSSDGSALPASDDIFGDGLNDLVASIGCRFSNCGIYANGSPGQPATLPDGTSIASLATCGPGGVPCSRLFINENIGTGAAPYPKTPELLESCGQRPERCGGVGVPAAGRTGGAGRPPAVRPADLGQCRVRGCAPLLLHLVDAGGGGHDPRIGECAGDGRLPQLALRLRGGDVQPPRPRLPGFPHDHPPAGAGQRAGIARAADHDGVPPEVPADEPHRIGNDRHAPATHTTTPP